MNSNKNFFVVENVAEATCSTGLKQSLAAVLACLFGIVFIFVETQNRFVRYCAIQSLFVWAGWMVLFVVFSIFSVVPLLGLIFLLIRALASLAMTIAIAALAYLAYRGKKVVVPFVSRYAEEWSMPDE